MSGTHDTSRFSGLQVARQTCDNSRWRRCGHVRAVKVRKKTFAIHLSNKAILFVVRHLRQRPIVDIS
jgi:hypothetical protein